MDHKTAQEIALKRYGFIAPFVSGNIDKYKSKSDFFRFQVKSCVQPPDQTF